MPLHPHFCQVCVFQEGRKNHIQFCSLPQTQHEEHHLAHSRCSINTENKGIKESSEAQVEVSSRAHTINIFTHTFTPFCTYCTFSCTRHHLQNGNKSMINLTESVCIQWIVKGSWGGWSSWKHLCPLEMESRSSQGLHPWTSEQPYICGSGSWIPSLPVQLTPSSLLFRAMSWVEQRWAALTLYVTTTLFL